MRGGVMRRFLDARRSRKRSRQIRHRGEIKTPLGIERMIKLRGAKGPLAERRDILAQFLR